MAIVIFATVLALSALYAPQPLLPVIVREFGVTPTAAALLTTVSFIPLSLAPLGYGLVLETVSPRRVLRVSVLLLALSEVLFALARTFPQLVTLRLLQGLLIPAILTSLMTYLSVVSDRSQVQRAMAIYIAATILGGFLGRAGSGLIASQLGWRYTFLVLALSLGGCFLLLGRLRAEERLKLARPRAADLLEILREKTFRRVYLLVFCLFLVFAAVMNFIPFRLEEISDQADEFRIGLIYSGYVMGIVTSLSAVRCLGWLGSETRVLRVGLAGFAAALLALGFGSIPALFATMFLFCGAMFLVHATASGLLNRLSDRRAGLVNGLYVSFYYAGGVAGSYLPGFVYRWYGWPGFLLALFAVSLLALLIALALPSPSDSRVL